MTKQMKQMMQELEERHKRELQEFDEATKKPQLRSVRLELQSINLNFGNLSLSGKDDEQFVVLFTTLYIVDQIGHLI